MQGPKTHEQFTRNLERKPDIGSPADAAKPKHPDTEKPEKTRQSEFPVSRGGMNQESDHNKHNRPSRGAPKH
jgi:hypothetical protein